MTVEKKNRRYDLVVIGNGVAGNNAAFSARKVDPYMTILILGSEKYPEYAAGALPDYLSGHLKKEEVLIKSFADYEKKCIDLSLEEKVLSIDADKKHIITDKDREIQYGKLIIATGSFPVQLRKMEGTGLPGNFVLKSIQDVDDIMAHNPRSAVVVGSGAIGLEGALALKTRGVEQVTIVEMLDWIIMKSVDEYTASLLTKELNDFGIDVYVGENVLSVEGSNMITGVKTNKRDIPCDMVLWAIGVRPNVELAKVAGIEMGVTGGIAVDECMRTNLPDIYACGDCTESTDRFRKKQFLNLLWESAARQGTVAGCCCAGLEKDFNGSFLALITYIGEKPVVAFGYTEKDLEGTEYELLEEKTETTYRRILLQEGKVVGVQMINTMEGASALLAQLQKESPIDEELPEEGDAARYAAMQTAIAAYIKQMREASVVS